MKTETKTIHDELIEVCKALIEACEALDKFIYDGIPDNQQRKAETIVKQARQLIAQAEGSKS